MKKTVQTFAVIALVVAVVRFFLKMILDPIGVPVFVGSLLASITIVLLIAAIVMFRQAGRDPAARYFPTAAWYFLLSAWCQILIIGGILLTERTHANTYYAGPWEMVKERFPTAAAHAIGHAEGFWVLTAVLLIVGAITYAISRRERRRVAAALV